MGNKISFVLGLLLFCNYVCYGGSPADSTPPDTYVVKDMGLMQKVGDLQNPEANPEYEGGIEELKRYFAENSLEGEVESVVFRVHIYFLVDKNGVAKDFKLLNKVEPRTPEKQKLQDWSIDVLGVVSEMPQRWIPAQVDGEAVDCYQVLSFTVVEGRLDKTVGYR